MPDERLQFEIGDTVIVLRRVSDGDRVYAEAGDIGCVESLDSGSIRPIHVALRRSGSVVALKASEIVERTELKRAYDVTRRIADAALQGPTLFDFDVVLRIVAEELGGAKRHGRAAGLREAAQADRESATRHDRQRGGSISSIIAHRNMASALFAAAVQHETRAEEIEKS